MWWVNLTSEEVCSDENRLCTGFFLFEATPIAREELRELIKTKYGVDSMTQAMIIGDYKVNVSL